MQSLTLGDLTFTANEEGVSLLFGKDSAPRATLSAREVGQLEEFLRRNAPRERRVGFRVPFGPLSLEVRAGFEVQLEQRGQWHPVTPVDLSLTGILIKSKGLVLPVGSRVRAQISFQGVECRLKCEVVRGEEQLVALHFVESISRGDLDPPEALLTIYRNLEMEWLRTRVS